MIRCTIRWVIALMISAIWAHGQDIIIKRNGDEIRAKVVEITPSMVVYTLPVNAEVIRKLPTVEVFMIKFEDGSKRVFPLTTAPAQVATPPSAGSPMAKTLPAQIDESYKVDSAMNRMGRVDAELYFKGYKTHATLSLLAGVPCSPIVPAGVIVPLGLTLLSGEVMMDDVNSPYLHNNSYQTAYKARARKIRLRRIWGNYLLGYALTSLGVFYFLFN